MTDDIGRKIKKELERQGMSISQLVRKTKLPQSSVDNIIYGRSKKRDIIAKIARSLAIPIDYLLESNENNTFNASLYHLIFNVTYEQFAANRVNITKENLDEYCYNTYLYAAKEKIKDADIIRSYISGMTSLGIRQGYLKVR